MCIEVNLGAVSRLQIRECGAINTSKTHLLRSYRQVIDRETHINVQQQRATCLAI